MLRGPEAGTDLPEVSVIPKIFHQVWLGPNPMPDEYLRYRDTWAQHHPEWEFRLWSEQNLPVTLQREEARDRLRVPAERADMLRLEVLLESGGVYIDTDMECLRSIEELIADVDLFVADSKPGHANNAVIGALPGHPFLALALRECRPREFAGYDKAAAGPWLIDRLVRENPGIKVFEPWVFYPSTPEERSRAYAIHHVARSWKDADGFRRSALIAEKRLQEVQDELWRLMQEIDEAARLTDAEAVRARLAKMAADNAGRQLSPAVKNKPRTATLLVDEPHDARVASAVTTLEKRVGQLTRLRRQLERIDKRVARLDERVEHLEAGAPAPSSAAPGAKGSSAGAEGNAPPATSTPSPGEVPTKDERRRRKAEKSARRQGGTAAVNEEPVAIATKTEPKKKDKQAKGKGERGHDQRRRGIFARLSKFNRVTSKQVRKAAKRTQRAFGRFQNMRYRSTYATRLDLVKDRDELPVVLNHRGLLGWGVEIGVKTGAYSDLLLKVWKGERLISVDPWLEDAPESYVDRANVPQTRQNEFYEMTRHRLSVHGERSVIWRKTSAEAAKDVERHSLDFVYIDARHDYESVLEDLHLWYDRVRPGGIIAGHDYADGVFEQGVFGVKRAVDEFFAALKIPVYSTEGKYPIELFASWLVEKPAVSALVTNTPLPFARTGPQSPEVSAVG